ncbi:MAG: polyprenyl synthetase family protein [Sphingobacteriales bacterium]|nr:polyprenyl synthetase family protein [Sphingobacteriales bacterium]MBI3719350.1 polyprenyl synthetase family protein [Sphingobacteriales bacterium]
MHSFKELLQDFDSKFNTRHFPNEPATLYDSAQYILSLGGKRVRPVMCLMGNELFDDINPDAYHVATAIELFHNFSLIHDDIMDKAPLRRGMPTVHAKFGESTALLAGDVMLVMCYEYLNKIDELHKKRILSLFNKTALEVSEGQQLDMDFEKINSVSLNEYIRMIELKTSVLLGASLKLGAIIGGASEGNVNHLYEFGKNLGIAFQVQDDYLDAFGDPDKFGKQVGGDIIANKKTFLLIHTMDVAEEQLKQELLYLMQTNPADKVQRVLVIMKACNADAWAKELKEKYVSEAMRHLEEIAVMSKRKEPLRELAQFLVQRDH